jgi:hypothetical protein
MRQNKCWYIDFIWPNEFQPSKPLGRRWITSIRHRIRPLGRKYRTTYFDAHERSMVNFRVFTVFFREIRINLQLYIVNTWVSAPHTHNAHAKSTNDEHDANMSLEYFLISLVPPLTRFFPVQARTIRRHEKYAYQLPRWACPNAVLRITLAVFRPTPGKLSKSARHFGTSP